VFYARYLGELKKLIGWRSLYKQGAAMLIKGIDCFSRISYAVESIISILYNVVDLIPKLRNLTRYQHH
jgi:hypothetical protein